MTGMKAGLWIAATLFAVACCGEAEPIKWFDGTWDDSGAPRGKLISGNPRWFGERTFTEIDYEYERAPTWLKDVRNKEFGRRLLRGPTGAPEQYPQLRTVANKDGTPIVVVFDFKRTRVLTEVDVVAERSTNATGFVEFSDDKSVWRTRTTFRHAGTITRIRFPAGALGRYMRLSVMAGPDADAKNAKDGPPCTYLDEVLVWGDPDAPAVVAGDLTEIQLGDALSFNAAAKGAISILPMAIPHLAVKPYGRTPDEIFLTMARNETETRYFAIVNGTDASTSVAISAPDFGEGISAELLIGGVLPVAPPKRKLSRREMVQLATNDENGINNGEVGELDVLPFFFADARGNDGFRRRYLANARQIAGFPGSVPLDPGQGCVVMLRVTTSGAGAGRREGQLAAAAAKLPVRLNVVDLALPEQSMWIYAYRPFTQQYPFESASRMRRDVERYAGMGATTVKHLPEPRTKERRFFRLVPQMSVGSSIWLDDGLYKRVNNGEFNSLMKDERRAIVSGARRFLDRGRALGLSDSHICAFLPDEPGLKNGKSVIQLARLVKESVPELMVHCNPLFFCNGGFCEPRTIKDSLLPEYNTFVDISCPFGTIAIRKGLMEDLWLKPRKINAMYSHPAGKTGREMVYECHRHGFNGFAYYCYYHPNGSDPWDIATWGVLNYNYQAVFPLEGDVALTPLYETLREAAEDSRMLDALKAAGKDAVLRDVLERSKTAWDRTHFQYRLKDSTAEDILSLRETILAAFAK